MIRLIICIVFFFITSSILIGQERIKPDFKIPGFNIEPRSKEAQKKTFDGRVKIEMVPDSTIRCAVQLNILGEIIDSTWISKEVITYNDFKQLQTFILYRWDEEKETWLGEEKYEYYSTDYREIDSLFAYIYCPDKKEWIPDYKTISSYNWNGVLISTRISIFDENQEWQYLWNYDYYFNDFGPDSVLYRKIEEGIFIDYWKDIYFYDSMGNDTLIEEYINIGEETVDWVYYKFTSREFDKYRRIVTESSFDIILDETIISTYTYVSSIETLKITSCTLEGVYTKSAVNTIHDSFNEPLINYYFTGEELKLSEKEIYFYHPVADYNLAFPPDTVVVYDTLYIVLNNESNLEEYLDGVDVYPTVFQNSLTVNNSTNFGLDLRIIDMNGYVLFMRQVFPGKNQIILNNLEAGTYILYISDNRKYFATKIIKSD